jgi:hypothetical protein
MCLVILVSFVGGWANSQQLNLDKNNADKGNNIQYTKIDSIGLSYDPCAFKVRCDPLGSTSSNILTSNFLDELSGRSQKKKIAECRAMCEDDAEMGNLMCMIHSAPSSRALCYAKVSETLGACYKKCG